MQPNLVIRSFPHAYPPYQILLASCCVLHTGCGVLSCPPTCTDCGHHWWYERPDPREMMQSAEWSLSMASGNGVWSIPVQFLCSCPRPCPCPCPCPFPSIPTPARPHQDARTLYPNRAIVVALQRDRAVRYALRFNACIPLAKILYSTWEVPDSVDCTSGGVRSQFTVHSSQFTVHRVVEGNTHDITRSPQSLFIHHLAPDCSLQSQRKAEESRGKEEKRKERNECDSDTHTQALISIASAIPFPYRRTS